MALAAIGLLEATAALHVFTAGAIGLMTLAIMSRATRGHTGLPLTAPLLTGVSYAFMVAGAFLRPAAALIPDHYLTLVSLSGLCWMAAFSLYLVEYAPALVTRRKPRPA
ncbi:NnrS protein [compost metagenome]